jgi:hypothetical protein
LCASVSTIPSLDGPAFKPEQPARLVAELVKRAREIPLQRLVEWGDIRWFRV